MTKIKELDNTQLLQNIEKYRKILSGLHKERARRVEAEPSLKETLFTKEEILQEKKTAPAEAPAPTPAATPTPAPTPEKQSEGTSEKTVTSVEAGNNFQINFEDSEIEQINTATAKEQEQSENEEDAVRMTEVLQLTEKQLNEFNQAKKAKKS